MKMLSSLARAFRPLDTSEADAAIAAARRSQRDIQVRARALRMDVSCGDPAEAIDRIAGNVLAKAGHMLRAVYHPAVAEAVPPDMLRRLDDI